jgi:predicted RNase H-like nuclease (RuvC/YqgF family)
MAKSKGGSEIEHLRGQIREKDKEIKKLKAELTRFKKRENQLVDVEERERELNFLEASPKKKQDLSCPECLEGTLSSSPIGTSRILKTCNKCMYRITVKVQK